VPLTDGIREFVARDWHLVRASKEKAWQERVDRMGHAEGLRMAEALRVSCRSLGADPGAEEARTQDLRMHIRLSELLARASPLARR
jgi:hypothetical protein